MTIHEGQTYQRARGLWDGEWRTYKVCESCEELRADWQDSMRWDDLLGFGDLADRIHGHYSGAGLAERPAVLAFIGRCYYADSDRLYPTSKDDQERRGAKGRALASELERAGRLIQELAGAMEVENG